MVCNDFYKRSGVRCLPQGQNRGKKNRIDLTLRKTLTPRSSESGFHRNVKFATFEEAGRLCKTIPQNGVKVAPLGGQERPKFAPLTFYGVGRPMKWAVLHHINRFSIEHNSGSQCHRDKGVGSFDSDDQSASQDHCEAIKPCP